MAVSTTSLLDEALKQFYLDVAQYQMNDQADPILALLEKNSNDVVGSELVFNLRYGRSGGFGYLASDTATLPTANARKAKKGTTTTKDLAFRLQISEKLIQASQSRDGAWVNELNDEMEAGMNDAKDALSADFYGDGTGALATLAAATTQTTFTVSSTDYLAEGMIVDICASDGTVKQAGREITAVDHTNLTITVSGAAFTTLATDLVVRQGSYGVAITGLGKIFAQTGTLYGIDRATNPWFTAQTMAAPSGNITEALIMKGVNNAEKFGGGKTKVAVGSYGVGRAIGNLLTALKRFPNTVELKAGWKGLPYAHPGGEFVIVSAKYAPSGKLRLLDTDDFRIGQLSDWYWMNRDGRIVRNVANTAAWEATLLKYAELICTRPKAQVEITGITEA